MPKSFAQLDRVLESAGLRYFDIRTEGKDYVVQDGDIIHFRFNV